MTVTEVVIAGKPHRLGRRIGKGGEGEIFVLSDDPSRAVKVYTLSDLSSRKEKVAAMVSAELAKRAPLVAFPISIAQARSGAFLGFVMRLVDGYKPLHELYSPGPRKHHFPQADYRFLVRTAANVARAVASVHQSNCVIGDINHSGILVSTKATVALIDADSFQVSHEGRSYLCRVGVPEYTPPELQGKSLDGVIRTPNHDAFGLAVVVFQLLFMGRHPFVGTVRKGDIPPLHENIQHYRYAYAENRNVGMDQPPGTPDIADFFPSLAQVFDEAFSKESADRRPTAAQWVKQLEALESYLVRCSANPLHFGPRDASECAWCEMENRLQTVLFVPYLGPTATVTATDPGASAFNLDAVWKRITAVPIPLRDALRPALPSTSVTPSSKAKEAKSNSGSVNYVAVFMAALSFVVLIIAPPLAVVLVPILLYWLFSAKPRKTIDGQRFQAVYLEAEALWERELDNWYRRIGVDDNLRLKSELEEARDQFLRAAAEEKTLIAKYRSDRREKQLHAYLDAFSIVSTKINGIGPAKLATLASYGIDTAADVSRNRLLAVPGFGDTTSQGLLEWRARLETRFVYQAAENATDRQEIARIRALSEAKQAQLRTKLLSGVQTLELASRRIYQFASQPDSVLGSVHLKRMQAREDLSFLGLPIPATPPKPSPGTRSTGAPPFHRTPVSSTPSPGSGSSATGAKSCPRCGSAMVRRLARRGRNAGNYFWGCSRYPSCRGTRNA
jgi:DNA-binding helix-hairpin-helix protein with protein kinase domain